MFNLTPLLTFMQNSQFGLSRTFSSVTPVFARANASAALTDFRAQTNGADPEPIFANPPPMVPGIPEPGAWVMMIAGMGLVGFARRRRNGAVAA